MECKKVKAKWVVGLTNGSKVGVKEGQQVDEGEVLAEVKETSEERKMVIDSWYDMSEKERGKLREKIVGEEIGEGEVIYKAGGMFGKKIIAGSGGKVVRVDEFGNFYLQSSDEKRKVISSPVSGKVVKVGDEEIVLEFGAMEYQGEGLTEGKVWGQGLREITRIPELTSEDNGRVLVIRRPDETMLVKAEVVGIKGIVVSVLEKSDRIKTRLPTLAMEEDLIEKLKAEKDIGERAILLDAAAGRLLVEI